MPRYEHKTGALATEANCTYTLSQFQRESNNAYYQRLWNQVIRSPYQNVIVGNVTIGDNGQLHATNVVLQPLALPLSLPPSPQLPAGAQTILATIVSPSPSPSPMNALIPLPPLSPTQLLIPLPLFHADGEEFVFEAIQPATPSHSATSLSASPAGSLITPDSPQAVVQGEVQPEPLNQSPTTSFMAVPIVAQHSSMDNYTDGGDVSNAMALPMLVIYITHITQSWAHVFLHSWHLVFHTTHTSYPASNLVQCANRALRSAYRRWDATRPNEPLLRTFVTLDGQHMMAIRRTEDSPAHEIHDIVRFEKAFTSVIRMARQTNMNCLLQCTLGAIVVSQIVPFLPLPHADIRAPGMTSTFQRLYTPVEKEYLTMAVAWNPQFGCRIWHRFDGDHTLWFANHSVREFLAILLSPDEHTPYTLGVRRARRGLHDEVLSWGSVIELDNESVLALLAKTLASLSVSVLYDVVQTPRQFPFDRSDTHRNSLINKLTEQMIGLLRALDDTTLQYSQELTGVAREEGHAGLLGLKLFLGFA